jgi:hypothetical protein
MLKLAAMLVIGGLGDSGPQGGTDSSGLPDLPQAALQSVYQVLGRDYLEANRLTPDWLNHAALLGMVSRLQPGIAIEMEQPADGKAAEPKVLSAGFDGDILWLRPLTLQRREVEMARDELEKFCQSGVKGVILDLRQPSATDDFRAAAALADLFVPEGVVLFRARRSGEEQAREVFTATAEPAWEGPLVVCVDSETGPAGEIVAAVLQGFGRAILTGGPTGGATVRYQRLPLGEGWVLKYAAAEMQLADGTVMFRKGLTPELAVEADAGGERDRLRLMTDGRAAELVRETPRPRFNEAALVAGKNPELESYLRRAAPDGDPEDKTPLVDPVLQRAADLLRLDQWREQSSRNLAPESPPARAPEPPAARKAIPAQSEP